MYPLTTSESSTGDSSSKSSAGPSRNRCRSPTTTMTLPIPALGALVPNRADLLPPHKRFRDSYSSGDSVEEDIEVDAAAVEAAAAMNVKAGIDADEIEMIRVIELAVADDIVEPANEGYPNLELYDHMHEIPIDRIADIKAGQRYLEADGLIASGERERERERELVCLIMLCPWRGATRGFE
ncbi:hypothetical protein Tco_0541065, partial [Tanacetum coccineum]